MSTPADTLAPRPSASGATAAAPGRRAATLAALADPEWPLLLLVLLTPAGLCLALGDAAKASFFLGSAIYVAVLTWLGWVIFGRWTTVRPRFLLFPADFFVGLALVCIWFYVRNLVATFWPASYGLHELAWLFPALLGLHVAALLVTLARQIRTQARSASEGAPSLALRVYVHFGQRLLLYGPFATLLVVAMWSIGGSWGVTGTDAIHHTLTARVYLNEGMDFGVPPLGNRINYPAGFGSMIATAAAVAPLSVVQAFHLQHVVLCIAAVFLVTTALAALVERSLPLLHLLPLPFLFVFPLYALYPDLLYPGTPKQAGPPLCVAICLLPALASTTGRGPFVLALGLCGVLAALAVALNPACAPFAAVATVVAAVILAYRGGPALGWPRRRVLLIQAALALLAAALVLGNDPYYRVLVRRAAQPWTAQVAAVSRESLPAPPPPAFSPAKGLRAAARVNPLLLSPIVSATSTSAHYDHLRDWTEKGPSLAFLVLTGALVLLVVGPLALRRRRAAVVGVPLVVVLLTALGLRLALKYGVALAAGGLSLADPQTALLSVYLRYLVLRCELLLLFACLAAAGAQLYLVMQSRGRLPAGARASAAIVLAAACWLLPVVWLFVPPAELEWSGTPTLDQNRRFHVTPDDLRLAAWIDAHLPPDTGAIGLAAFTFRAGTNNAEHHIYALDGGLALALYGRAYNVRFLMPALEGWRGFDDYETHVHDHFDAAWCRANGIRYFYVTAEGFRENPGLAQAKADGRLRLVHAEGASAVYEVVQASV